MLKYYGGVWGWLTTFGVDQVLLRLHCVYVQCQSHFVVPFKVAIESAYGVSGLSRIFNIVVDAIVREWLCQALGLEIELALSSKNVLWFLALFYAVDGILALQGANGLKYIQDILV